MPWEIREKKNMVVGLFLHFLLAGFSWSFLCPWSYWCQNFRLFHILAREYQWAKYGKFTTGSVAFRILALCSKLPSIIYFSEYSNNLFMHSVQILWLPSVERQGGLCLFYSTLNWASINNTLCWSPWYMYFIGYIVPLISNQYMQVFPHLPVGF